MVEERYMEVRVESQAMTKCKRQRLRKQRHTAGVSSAEICCRGGSQYRAQLDRQSGGIRYATLDTATEYVLVYRHGDGTRLSDPTRLSSRTGHDYITNNQIRHEYAKNERNERNIQDNAVRECHFHGVRPQSQTPDAISIRGPTNVIHMIFVGCLSEASLCFWPMLRRNMAGSRKKTISSRLNGVTK